MIVENLPVPFDRRVWMEATALKSVGYEVVIVCPAAGEYPAERTVIDGIVIHRHPLPEARGGAAAYAREYLTALSAERRLARRVWREGRFDVIHMCNPPDLIFLVALPYKLLHRVRVVFDQHDVNPELFEAKFGRRGVFYRLLRLAERMTFASADVVISTNESYRQIALTRGRKAAEDVFVVRSAPDLDRFEPVPPELRYKMGKAFAVGYVGVIGEQEGVEYLIDAARYLVQKKGRSDIHFMVIGDGPARARLLQRRDGLGLADVVEFTGRVHDAELLERLSTCDVCVNCDPPTPFNSMSTMNKVLEYMSLGKPIVQFDLAEGRRSAGGASLYVERADAEAFGDAIASLLDDPERRRAMGEAGRSRMQQSLGWAHQSPRLVAAYERALSE